tara:strand:- start:167435 stop:167740 length:306 start_codon:yes stop_codon:yes gene_type:complete
MQKIKVIFKDQGNIHNLEIDFNNIRRDSLFFKGSFLCFLPSRIHVEILVTSTSQPLPLKRELALLVNHFLKSTHAYRPNHYVPHIFTRPNSLQQTLKINTR